MLPVFLG